MKLALAVMLFQAQAFAQVQSSSPPSLADLAAERLRELIPQLQSGEDTAVVANSTFRVSCNGIAATGFILLKPPPNSSDKPRNFLISAGHFFTDCLAAGRDFVKVNLRYPLANDTSKWDLKDSVIRIAADGRPLWQKHPRGDVGVIPIEIPEGAVLKPLLVGMLADAPTLRRELYFGRNAFSLGYPFAGSLSGLLGYPVLRPGQVAQPVSDGKADILIAFQIFPGDSGGPVYVMDRRDDSVQILIIGLVARTAFTEEMILNGGGSKPEKWKIQQGVGYIAPSTDIAETIKLFLNSGGG